MGMTPAKMFNPPTPFGSTPKTNNVSETQPLVTNQGPGYTNAASFDQTKQVQSPVNSGNSPFAMRRFAFDPRGDMNPFRGLLNQ